jgi:DMSO/TMAO reductase YedYZ molybdopterin-dependent catalytic subunit
MGEESKGRVERVDPAAAGASPSPEAAAKEPASSPGVAPVESTRATPEGEPASANARQTPELSAPAPAIETPDSIAPAAAPKPEPAPAATAAPAIAPPGSTARAAAPEPEPAPVAAAAPRRSWTDALAEGPETPIEIPAARLASQSRRDFLLFGLGLVAAAGGAWWLLPDKAKAHLLPGPAHNALDTLAARVGLTPERRERTLDRALTFDDDVAEALYSKDRRVRTYRRSEITPLRNNLAGRTPGPEILQGWSLSVAGLASGSTESFTVERLLAEFPLREQVTRFVCVEGWSAIAWWGGIRFADLLAKYPPASGTRWAAMRSAVSLDGAGRPDPYYVSIDLETAMHPQALLATHFAGRPLPLAHGAPLRLLVPMKLGLKNIKALTDIAYTAEEPADYWNERGYSKYDGI